MIYPKYVSHKEVTAARIVLVDPCSDGGLAIGLEGFPTVTFSHLELQRKPRPEAGWYLVQYADGYISFSPAKAFEDGYTLVDVKAEEPASYTHAEGDFAGDDDPYGIQKEYTAESAGAEKHEGA